MKNNVRYSRIIAFTTCLLMLGACQKKEAPKQERPPTPVQTAKVQVGSVPVYLPSFGRLKALNNVDIVAQVSGKVLEAPFDEGMPVKQGDVLFRIEEDTYRALMEQATARVEGGKASLKQKKATLKRNDALKEQSLISQEDYEQLKTDVEASQAALAADKAALIQAQINLSYCTITSPVFGVTGKRLVDPGNVVTPGNQKMVNVQTIDPLYLDFSISEAWLADIQNAMAAGPVPVLILLKENAGDAGIFHGVLKMVNNSIDTQSGTIALRAVVENAGGKLWPGQFVTALPVLRNLENAVVAPLAAIAQGKDGPYAFVINEGKAVLVAVTKGPLIGEGVVITSGLKKGDIVVTQGQMGLWPGAPVSIQTTLESEQEAIIKKKLADPNVLLTIKTILGAGSPPEAVELFTGIPVDRIQPFISHAAPPEGDPDTALIQKMLRGGMSEEEIAKVTGLTIEAIHRIANPDDNPDKKPDAKPTDGSAETNP